MKIEQWPIGKPKPYAKNPRKIPDSAVAKVATSIKEYGWRQPIVVDRKGVVIVGHTRLLAARSLGLKVVPVHVAADLSAKQARAYRLMDNRSNQDSEWDVGLLAFELEGLDDFDLDLTGFGAGEIDEVLARAGVAGGLTDPDETPELPKKPMTKPGDVWLLGATAKCPKCGKVTDVK